MVRLKIPDRSYKKYNQSPCSRITFSANSLTQLHSQYHEIRGQPGFIDDFLHLRPESENAHMFAGAPHSLKWADDGSFFIGPNLGYLQPEALTGCVENVLQNDPVLIAWYVHPNQLEQTVFSQEDAREDFTIAMEKASYQPAPASLKSGPRSSKQKKIREIEEESGVPYLASVMDLTPEHLPWLKKLKKATIEYLVNQCGVKDDDYVALYFHTILPEDTVTLHLHIRVNKGVHPLDADKSIALDAVIDALEHGRAIKDMLLQKGGIYKHDTEITELMRDSGFDITVAPNPFVLSDNHVPCSHGKFLKEYKYDCGMTVSAHSDRPIPRISHATSYEGGMEKPGEHGRA